MEEREEREEKEERVIYLVLMMVDDGMFVER